MVTDVDPASLRVTWQPPPLIHQNGPIMSYFITYHRTDNALISGSVSAIGNESIVSSLDPFVSYSVQVAARNARGLGAFSSIIDEVSGQDGKCYIILHTYDIRSRHNNILVSILYIHSYVSLVAS